MHLAPPRNSHELVTDKSDIFREHIFTRKKHITSYIKYTNNNKHYLNKVNNATNSKTTMAALLCTWSWNAAKSGTKLTLLTLRDWILVPFVFTETNNIITGWPC